MIPIRPVFMTALTLPLLAPAAPAQSPDLNEVLARYYEAVGGLEAWQSLESMKATGTMTMGEGVEAPFTVMGKRPHKFRLEFTYQGMTGIQAYDGEAAWMLMPFLGATDPQPMPEEEAKQIEEEADIDGPLIGYVEEGHTIELLGKDQVEGTEAYRLKVTLKTGTVSHIYLDAEHFVPIKVETSRIVRGQEREVETSLGDYKEVDGLLMAHSIESKPKGEPGGQLIAVESVELNVPLADSLFTMPAPEGQ